MAIKNTFLMITVVMILSVIACTDSTETVDSYDPNESVFLLEEAYYTEGIDFVNSGDYKNAISSFDKAIELKPDYAEVFHNRGLTYLKLKNYAKATDDFTQVILLKPDKPEFLTMAFYNRGNIYNLLEQYNKGIDDYDKAIELNPDFVEAYYYRGNAHIKIREYLNFFLIA